MQDPWKKDPAAPVGPGPVYKVPDQPLHMYKPPAFTMSKRYDIKMFSTQAPGKACVQLSCTFLSSPEKKISLFAIFDLVCFFLQLLMHTLPALMSA